MKKYICLFFLLNAILIYSQNVFKGKILASENKSIPHAKITLKGTDYVTFSDLSGKFVIKKLKTTDTLQVTALGYHDTMVVVNLSSDSPLKIFLEKNDSEILDELIITTHSSKEYHWINFFGNKSGKFKKKYYRNKYYHVQTLFKGSANINQFIAVDTLKIRGFSVYTVDNIKQNIILRPIILQNHLDVNNNLVKDAVKIFSVGKKRTGKINSLEFSFEKEITFYPGEQVNIGVELVNSDYFYNDGKNYIPILCYNKETIPISSFRKEILEDEISGNFNTPKKYYERPFYFELKVVK